MTPADMETEDEGSAVTTDDTTSGGWEFGTDISVRGNQLYGIFFFSFRSGNVTQLISWTPLTSSFKQANFTLPTRPCESQFQLLGLHLMIIEIKIDKLKYVSEKKTGNA